MRIKQVFSSVFSYIFIHLYKSSRSQNHIMVLPQTEYEIVMALQKEFEDGITPLLLGPGPVRWTRQLFSPETREEFILDYHKGNIAIEKFVVNHRYRQSIILLRYCHTGRHTNPDGITLDGPHIHLYREGYADKFAFPAAEMGINISDDIQVIFRKVLQLCNIQITPTINFNLL